MGSKDARFFLILYLLPQISLSLSLSVSVHTHIRIYVRHMKLIILLYIFTLHLMGKHFKVIGSRGWLMSTDHSHIIFYIMSFWEVIRSTRSSGQLYYTRGCLFTISSCLLYPYGELCPNTINSNPEGHVDLWTTLLNIYIILLIWIAVRLQISIEWRIQLAEICPNFWT